MGLTLPLMGCRRTGLVPDAPVVLADRFERKDGHERLDWWIF
jgi:hypothetical protein